MFDGTDWPVRLPFERDRLAAIALSETEKLALPDSLLLIPEGTYLAWYVSG